MSDPQTPVDWFAVLLGAVGTVGATIAAVLSAWLWAGVIFVGSTVAQLLVGLVRRRKTRPT